MKVRCLKGFFVLLSVCIGLSSPVYAKDRWKNRIDGPVFEQSVVPAEAPVKIPILMYHDIVADGAETNMVSRQVGRLKEDLQAFQAAGFTTLFFSDLLAYVEGDGTFVMPEKPLVITFDDGYESNYTLAYPLFRENNMKATFFVIGWSIGRATRLDETTRIIPHFTTEQAVEMDRSGYIDIQSHSFALHELESEHYTRNGVMKREGETNQEYAQVLFQDNQSMDKKLFSKIGEAASVFAYPYGFADSLSEEIIKIMGYKASVLTGDKIGAIQKGNLNSLFGLYRINVDDQITSQQIIERLGKE